MEKLKERQDPLKLKLDSQQDNLTILAVSEAIDPKHLPVLRAGVTKLLQGAADRNLVLDLTSVHPPSLEDPEVVNALTALRQATAARGHRLLIASNRSGLGDAATAEACAALLKAASDGTLKDTAGLSPLPPQEVLDFTEPVAAKKSEPGTPEQQEAELKATLDALKTKRAAAQKAIDARASESDAIRKLQHENNRIRKLIGVLETEIQTLLKARAGEPIDPPSELKSKLTDVNQVLETLTQSFAKAGGAK